MHGRSLFRARNRRCADLTILIAAFGPPWCRWFTLGQLRAGIVPFLLVGHCPYRRELLERFVLETHGARRACGSAAARTEPPAPGHPPAASSVRAQSGTAPRWGPQPWWDQ